MGTMCVSSHVNRTDDTVPWAWEGTGGQGKESNPKVLLHEILIKSTSNPLSHHQKNHTGQDQSLTAKKKEKKKSHIQSLRSLS